MPLTPEQKRKLVIDSGLDPNEYTWDDGTSAETIKAPNPYDTLNPVETKVATPPIMSGMEAFKTRLPRALVPSAATLGGMALGAAVPVPGLDILTTIGGGIAGSYLGNRLQDKALQTLQSPENYQKGQALQDRAVAEHPIISQLTDQLPMVAAFSPAGIPKAAGALGKILVGARPTIAGAEALTQTGINAAVGGGADIAEQKLIEKKPEIDWTRAGISTLAGGALSKPTSLGRALFPEAVRPTAPEIPQPNTKPVAEIKVETPIPQKQLPYRAGYTDKQGVFVQPSSGQTIVPPANPVIDPLGASSLKLEEQLAKAPPSAANELQAKQKQLPLTSESGPFIAEPSPSKNYTLDDVLNSSQIADLYYSHTPINAETLSKVLRIDKNKANNLMREWNTPENTDLKPVVPEAPAKTRTIDEGTKYYQPDGKTLKPGLTPEQLTEAKAYAEKRGIRLEQTPEILRPSDQSPQRGSYKPTERLASVSDIATTDTPYHEVFGHGVMDDFRNSKLQADRVAHANGVRAAGSEEALAEAIGKRIVDVNNKPLQSWLRDFWGNTKRLVRLGNDEDTINHLARRARDDRPYSESPELWNNPTEDTQVRATPKDGDIKYSKPGTGPEDTRKAPSNSFLPIMESEVDKLKSSANPSDRKAAAIAEKFRIEQRQYLGQLQNRAHELTARAENPAAVNQWLHENRFTEGKSTVALSPKDQALTGELRKLLVDIHDEQRAIGRKVGAEQREAKDDPFYSPTVVDTSVIKTFMEGKDTKKIESLKQDYIKHQMAQGTKEAGAHQMLDTYLRNLNSPEGHGNPEFGAVNQVQGRGLPYSWVDKSLGNTFKRYTDRVARDFAFHKAVLSDPEARIIFNYKDRFGKSTDNPTGIPPSTNPALQNVFRQLTGGGHNVEANYKALESVIRSGFLGTLTGLNNHLSGYGLMASYLPIRDLPAIFKSWQHYSQGLADSMREGVNRYHTLDLEVKDSGPGYFADRAKAIGNTLRQLQGSNAIEKGTRAVNMMTGEIAAESIWGRVKAGSKDVGDHRFLRQFGEPGMDYQKDPITREAILKMAARFVEKIQGTYDERGLPNILMTPNTPLYWLFNLSKWSVERSNNFKKDVWNPLTTEGDWGPMLKSVLGATLTGAAIEKLRELLNNKKNNTPNLTEISTAGGADDWAFKFAELQAMGSSLGIVGDAALALGSKAKGYRTRELTIPTVSAVEDTASSFMNALGAIHEGQPAISTMFQWALDTMVNNIQAARIIKNQVSSEDNARKDKIRDLNVYKHLTDKATPAPGDYNTNPYEAPDAADFKHSKYYEKAKKIMDEKIKPRLEGDPNRKDKLEGLKRNSYQTIPTDRKERKAYLEYLDQTQGVETRTALEEDKKKQDFLNKRKTRLVPRR